MENLDSLDLKIHANIKLDDAIIGRQLSSKSRSHTIIIFDSIPLISSEIQEFN